MTSKAVVLKSADDVKVMLAGNYQKQIMNYFGDDKKSLKFLSGVVSSVQRNPKLLECRADTVINSFMTMAQLELMPSDVAGEAYVIPYKGEAQFQLGYQGLVTLFYRAGVKSIIAEIVYSKDEFSFISGEVYHNPDVFAKDRGNPIGAYVIVETQQGGKIQKVMSELDIMNIGKNFSKSFKSEYSPWNVKNDPELWMWKKTVLKQCAKLVPKNETIYKAIEADNEDSVVSDRNNKLKEKAEDAEVWVAEVNEITDLKALEKYYKANEGRGAEFARLVTKRKKEIESELEDKKQTDEDS